MKRGIDERNMWPMFPRLHVNDPEKGGPRAPPRNKMALYEQLSIRSSQKKKQEDDAFRVPILVQQSEINLDHSDPVNGDVVYEASMVDSISRDDISPDNVVGIMGHNHFLKARRAIVNQQKTFSGQVFELHRLIKVQKLIAGIPQPMVEDVAFLGKLAKVSPIKKVHVEYAMKWSTNVPKLKDYHEKPKDDTRNFSVDNAVEKESIFSAQNNHHPTFQGIFYHHLIQILVR
ncbi:hypothetical protein L6452_16835 [Arctium lappa]|uniref:Uncharacterized protein n=1 Tax=Arctium lappa TaxID=4217 RepID=A0ACB9C1T3_ARCLA|nr:hypothetical protein L6452_16835 [Arctium lappa]